MKILWPGRFPEVVRSASLEEMEYVINTLPSEAEQNFIKMVLQMVDFTPEDMERISKEVIQIRGIQPGEDDFLFKTEQYLINELKFQPYDTNR